MKDTRLIKIIKTFDKEELKSFGKYLESPFLKPARNIKSLYEYLIKFYPDYNSDKLKKEIVFSSLFKNEVFNEKKLINLMSDLTRSAEKFLAYNIQKEDESDYLINLSKAFQKKKLSEESNKVNKQIEKLLKPGFSSDKDYISKFRRLTLLKSNYFIEENDYANVIECKKNYFEVSAFQFIVDYTDLIGSIEPSKNTYGKKINDKFIENVVQCFDLEKLLKSFEQTDYKNKNIILLHYYILKMNTEKKDTSFYYRFRDLFYEIIYDFDLEERNILFNDLIHYCVQNFEMDNREFKKEMLNVYKKMLETNSYTSENEQYMQEMTYRNIFFSCVTERDSEYLEFFIKKYSEEIQPDLRINMKNFASGYLYYIRKEFEKALTYASQINQEFFLFKTDLKNLMLIIYYELDYTEQAFSLIDSYKHFIAKTKEIQESYKKVYSRYLKFYSKLLKIKCGQSKESPEYLKKQIEKEKILVSRKWLLEKADELISDS